MSETLTATININSQMSESQTTTLLLQTGNLETGFYNTVKNFSGQYPSTSITKKYTASFTSTGNLNLTNASLVDGFGVALTFANWNVVIVQNNDTAHTMTIGGGTHPLTGMTNATLIGEGPSCFVFLLNLTGNTVVNASSNMLNISGSSVAYDVIILGS